VAETWSPRNPTWQTEARLRGWQLIFVAAMTQERD
jgi:hypothetical protein